MAKKTQSLFKILGIVIVVVVIVVVVVGVVIVVVVGCCRVGVALHQDVATQESFFTATRSCKTFRLYPYLSIVSYSFVIMRSSS